MKIKDRAKLIWKDIAGFFILFGMWFKNLWYVFVSSNSKVRIFEGWLHWWFAKKYADKRYRISRINKYCGGKRHYVLPAGDYSLIVLSTLELRFFKKQGYYKTDIKKILESAYYVTK